MISINNKKIDLLFQVEKDVPLNKILNGFSLDSNRIAVVCPSIFFSNVIGDLYDFMQDEKTLLQIEKDIKAKKEFIEFKIKFKNKEFELVFLITPSESKIVNDPFKGDVLFNVGFRKVEFI